MLPRVGRLRRDDGGPQCHSQLTRYRKGLIDEGERVAQPNRRLDVRQLHGAAEPGRTRACVKLRSGSRGCMLELAQLWISDPDDSVAD